MKDAWFVLRLLHSLFAPRRTRRTPFFMGSALVALALPLSGFYAASAATAMDRTEATPLSALVTRAAHARNVYAGVESYFASEVGPIERVLLKYRDDPALIRRVATSLVAQGRRTGIDPQVLLAVLLVENPMLEPHARSSAGATGLMQIMPLHQGEWKGCGPDLTDVEDNICYGARIFADYLKQNRGDVERALLAYNGCRRSEGCQVYANLVYARAGRASILASLRQ
jgi:soluble lytic murein transglycosylase-like protein